MRCTPPCGHPSDPQKRKTMRQNSSNTGRFELFNESIRLRSPNVPSSMFDIVGLQTQLVGVRFGAAKFPPGVGQDRLDGYSVLLVERRYVSARHRS